MFGKKIDRWLSEGIIKMMRKKANLERKEMRVEGHRIVYLENERKDKKTLILIHGSGDEKDTWLMVAPLLKEKYHLILIDLLGCGESELVEDFDYSASSQASFLQKIIEQMMDEKRIESFYLAGHSMGGLIVLLADKLPIEKLILIDTMGVHVKRSILQLKGLEIGSIDKLPWLDLKSSKELKELMEDSYYKPPYIPMFMLDYFLEKRKPMLDFEKKKFHYIVDEKEMLHKDDFTDVIKNIEQETLIVWGKNDEGIDVASAYKMQEIMPHATLKIYDECGHVPQQEKPKVLAQDIIEFLN